MTETSEAPWLGDVATAGEGDHIQVPIGGQVMTVVMRTPVQSEPEPINEEA